MARPPPFYFTDFYRHLLTVPPELSELAKAMPKAQRQIYLAMRERTRVVRLAHTHERRRNARLDNPADGSTPELVIELGLTRQCQWFLQVACKHGRVRETLSYEGQSMMRVTAFLYTWAACPAAQVVLLSLAPYVQAELAAAA